MTFVYSYQHIPTCSTKMVQQNTAFVKAFENSPPQMLDIFAEAIGSLHTLTVKYTDKINQVLDMPLPIVK